MMNEIWKELPNSNGLYLVSNKGKINNNTVIVIKLYVIAACELVS